MRAALPLLAATCGLAALCLATPAPARADDRETTRRDVIDRLNGDLHRHLPRVVHKRELEAVVGLYATPTSDGLGWDGAREAQPGREERLVRRETPAPPEPVRARWGRLFATMPVLERVEVRIERVGWREGDADGLPATIHMLARGTCADGFVDVAWVNGADRVEDGRGMAIADLDRDGQLDVVLRNHRQPAQLLRNRGGANHWLQLRLVGTASNRDAVGARVRVRTAAGWQTRAVAAGSGFRSTPSLVQHVGLGAATQADAVEIVWPSGRRQTLGPLAGDRRWIVVEGDDVPVESPRPARTGAQLARAPR